jgi:hypothetical protein
VLLCGGGCAEGRLNDLYLFDSISSEWVKWETVGKPFSLRKTHSISRVGSKMYLFGGREGTEIADDLHILDLTPVFMSTNTSTPTLIQALPSSMERDFRQLLPDITRITDENYSHQLPLVRNADDLIPFATRLRQQHALKSSQPDYDEHDMDASEADPWGIYQSNQDLTPFSILPSNFFLSPSKIFSSLAFDDDIYASMSVMSQSKERIHINNHDNPHTYRKTGEIMMAARQLALGLAQAANKFSFPSSSLINVSDENAEQMHANLLKSLIEKWLVIKSGYLDIK